MKRVLYFFLLITSNLQAQPFMLDTLRPVMLSEVIVKPNLQDGDTLQNFFRANKSATTENILSKMQGVYILRRGNYGQEPVIRGMSGGQINMTIDGMKVFGACTDKMDPVSIYVEPQNLRSIDAQVGSGGSRMGSTVGGTIDMQLAEARLAGVKWAGKAGAGYQSAWQGINAYANMNLSEMRSAYYVSLNYRKAQNYKAGGGEEIPYSQYEKLNLSMAGKWSLGRDTLQANVLLDEGRNIGFPALPMDVGSAKAGIYSLGFKRIRHHQWIEKISGKVYFNSIQHSMDDTHRSNVLMHMDMPGSSKTAGAYLEGNLMSMKKHAFSFRTDFYHNQVLAEMTMYPPGEPSMYMQTWPASGRSVAGFFINDLYTWSKGSKLNLNARFDWATTILEEGIGKQQLEVFYPAVPASSVLVAKTFNVKISQLLGEKFIADFHGGYGERLPTLSETFGFYLFNRNDGYDYIGRPDLVTEKNWTGDIAISYFGEKAQLTMSGFYNYLPDYIFSAIHSNLSPMTPGAHGVKVYENINSASLSGGEASLMASLFRNWQLITALKYVRGKDYQGNALPLIPPLTSTATLRYAKAKFNFQLENESAFAQEQISLSFGEDQTPGYSIFNARLGYVYTLDRNRILMNAGIENIFDTLYHNHLDWGNIPRPGRNFNFTVEVSF